jgi:cyclopropane-fatty-acyl-phospholipid synthase
MMRVEEFFVEYVQLWLPTWFVRFLVRMYMRIQGPLMRSGDVVIKQIETDSALRATLPVTTDVETVNEQLYGNDPYFFVNHLGPRLKYSACEYPPGVDSLASAEVYTIQRYQDLSGIGDLPAGSRVLELGCGWGSLSLANAERYPKLSFTSFSNSPQQIGYITDQAKQRGLKNLTVLVEDYAVFVHPDKSKVAPVGAAPFDAALAIETIEHAKNITQLLGAVALRLKPGAKLFVQSLLHQTASYLMDSNSWMGRNFFTGGSILSLNSYFHLTPPELTLSRVIPVRGTGYSRTLLDWLRRMEPQRKEFVRRYSHSFYEGFRMFYIASAEAFGANNGAEFMVGYYVFVKR